jgi:type IV pilus assembly protein PilY1
MKNRAVIVAAVFALVGLRASSAGADTVQFSQGAVIIPMQSTFQPSGGMVSAYGLVYRILQANAPGHRNANNPVTVYVVNNDGKSSPNRCQPTNFANRITGGANSSPAAKGTWNDGCDFSIKSTLPDGGAGTQPVTPVDYSTTFPGTGLYPPAAVKTFDDTNAWPRYNWSGRTLNSAGGFYQVNYEGAPFVIDAADVPAVINLMRNGDTGTNAVPKIAIDIFSDSQQASFCTPSSPDNSTGTLGPVTYSNGCHYVFMHQALKGFSANVDRRINRAPHAFALFNPSSQGAGGGVLDSYLQIAGLYVGGTANNTDSEGCAEGDVGGCTLNGSTCVSGVPCTAAQVKHGVIADVIGDDSNRYTSAAYPNGLINRQVNNSPYYHLYWAPHWDGSSGDAAAVANLVKYTNTKATAVMTECASITLYENGDGNTKSSISNTYGGPGKNANFLFTNGINVASTNSGANCSDPDFPWATSSCASYPNAGNLFSQVGDWKYRHVGGSNDGYAPQGGSARQAWTQQMVTTSNGNDAFDLGQQDANHAVVIYVSGHDVSGDPNGARIVLNSMLNLSADPISSERDIAAPVVAYGRSDSATTYVDSLLTGTYSAVSGYATNPAVQTFTPSSANLFVWPYFPGSFKSHDLSVLTSGEQSYDTGLLWNADNLSTTAGIAPLPGARNLFTYFGGYPMVNPTMPGGASAPHNILQWNWTPEAIDGTVVTSVCTPLGTPPTGCVDVMGYTQLKTSPTYDDKEPGFHMVVGSDGFCDLQEVMNFSKLNSGNDWTGGNCNAHDIKTFLQDAPNVAMLLQEVRGYCYAGALTALTPLDSACVDGKDNRAHLGGVVHATPAVIGPSNKVTDKGAKRPTVAYVGGLDGQMHAFYVGGGSGYKGPDAATNTVQFAWDDDAAAPSTLTAPANVKGVFKTSWGGTASSAFSPPAVGTELWSFLPASQLPHLFNNSAQVDSAPVVQDVFADFNGSGLREWHTVLLASVGTNGAEIFAMDVTNPLHPRLLWDTVGSLVGSPKYSPTMLLNDSLGGGTNLPPASATALDKVAKWNEGSTAYLPAPAADTGRTDTKVYDFQDLGGASGLTIAEIRVGLEPFYVAYATTAMPSGSGIEVFAIDVPTGQKLWQWQHAYVNDLGGKSGSASPPSATVVYGADGASRILVPDFDGRIWELDARTGANVNLSSTLTGCTAAAPCEFAAFDTQSSDSSNQPITTNIAVAKVPSNIGAGKALSAYAGATVLLFGTAGADWIKNPNSTSGNLHVVLYDRKRVPIGNPVGFQLDGTTAWTPASVRSTAQNSGVLQEPAGFPFALAAGERLYGNVTVTGQLAYFASASGSVGDIMKLSASTAGKTYALDLGLATAGTPATAVQGSLATFGGLAVYAPGAAGTAPTSVIGAEVSKINVISTSSNTNAAANPALSPTSGSWTSRLRNWLLRFK